MSTSNSHQLMDRAASATEQAAAQALRAAERGVAAVRDGSQHLLDRAHDASDRSVGFIRDEPVKAVLLAAATGAVLMALLGLLTRSRGRG